MLLLAYLNASCSLQLTLTLAYTYYRTNEEWISVGMWTLSTNTNQEKLYPQRKPHMSYERGREKKMTICSIQYKHILSFSAIFCCAHIRTEPRWHYYIAMCGPSPIRTYLGIRIFFSFRFLFVFSFLLFVEDKASRLACAEDLRLYFVFAVAGIVFIFCFRPVLVLGVSDSFCYSKRKCETLAAAVANHR